MSDARVDLVCESVGFLFMLANAIWWPQWIAFQRRVLRIKQAPPSEYASAVMRIGAGVIAGILALKVVWSLLQQPT